MQSRWVILGYLEPLCVFWAILGLSRNDLGTSQATFEHFTKSLSSPSGHEFRGSYVVTRWAILEQCPAFWEAHRVILEAFWVKSSSCRAILGCLPRDVVRHVMIFGHTASKHNQKYQRLDQGKH